jgi:DeoR/GlpR family transcriptional regulator of sugar metabolism
MKTRPGYRSELIRELAFEETLNNLSERQTAVFNMIKEFGPITTEQIALLMNVYPNYITGRIKELRDDLQLIEYAGFALSEKSGSKASLWIVKKPEAQLSLFGI